MSLTERDKKYRDKRRFQSEGDDTLIFEMLKLFNTSIEKKENKSEQVSFVENLCLIVAKTRKLKEKEQIFLAETIYKYAVGSGYLRVEKGRVTLTKKSKKYLEST